MTNSLSRRKFTQLLSITGVGLSIPGFLSSGCMTPEMAYYFNTLGLQLYTVRDQIKSDPVETLRAIKAHGYHQVELMDTNTIPSLMPIIKDIGLVAKSSFINWSIITGRWDLRDEAERVDYGFEKVVEDAHKAGLTHLVFGYMNKGERETVDDYRRVADLLNKAGEQCHQANIQLCYHNHSFEFEPMEGTTGYEVLIESLDHSAVKFELDVFWSSLGGVEPVGLMNRLGDRIELIHLKDKLAGTPVIYDEGTVPKDAFQELGNGIVDLIGVMDAAKKIGVTYCMVEQDQSPNPIESVGTSLRYVEKS